MCGVLKLWRHQTGRLLCGMNVENCVSLWRSVYHYGGVCITMEECPSPGLDEGLAHPGPWCSRRLSRQPLPHFPSKHREWIYSSRMPQLLSTSWSIVLSLRGTCRSTERFLLDAPLTFSASLLARDAGG